MKLTSVFKLVLLLVYEVPPTLSEISQCSPSRRESSIVLCSFKIQQALTDKNKFWFGNKYSSDCPNGPNTVFCQNSRYPNVDSIGTRILPNQLNLGLLNKYIEIKYSSETGNYSACGSTFVRDAWEGEVIPTASDVYRPWFLRQMPNITWSALVLHSYSGPEIAFDQANPYVFLLFKQKGQVNVSQEWISKMSGDNSERLSIPAFVSDYEMTGPVGVNWVVVTGDEYAANIMEAKKVMYTCPIFQSKAPRDDLGFVPESARFSVSVSVVFNNEPLNISACCTSESLGKSEASLKPFTESQQFSASDVRSYPSITFRKSGEYDMSTNFTGDVFTLILLGEAVDNLGALHQMVINIHDGNMSTGDVVQAYKSPVPQNNERHAYQFLLYRQEDLLNVSDMLAYYGESCSDEHLGRCPYDVNGLVRENNLTLIGANWMLVVDDAYAWFVKLTTLGQTFENATCFGRPGYPCSPPSTTSTSTLPSTTPSTTPTSASPSTTLSSTSCHVVGFICLTFLFS